MKPRHAIAVRTLVEVVLRAGDLDTRFIGPGRSLAGIRAHQAVQRQRPEGYRAEVPVSVEVETTDLILEIGGRIDGVLETEAAVLVEEIKSTTQELTVVEQSPDPCHWGQAKVYACLLARIQNLPAVTVRLTYCSLESGDTLELDESLTRDALESFFQGLIERYASWAMTLVRWRQCRDGAIDGLDFPFDAYRHGQRGMAVAVYRTIRDGGQALVQAATGIGKTMAALFPAVKTLGEGRVERIFFLTARNTGKAAAVQALDLLERKGLRLKRVCLTAKDRICFCPDASCTPQECEFAKGHFDRLTAALADAFVRDNLDRDAIETAARFHRVCPFELSLELCRWADCIIGDYNYAFDPRVYLRRFFEEENGAYAFLVDEAHNLVDRSRDMFSAGLNKAAFVDLRRAVKQHLPDLHRAVGKIDAWMRNANRRAREAGGFYSDARLPDGLEPLLRAFLRISERWLASNRPAPYREVVLERYFETRAFLQIWERFDDSYVACCRTAGRDMRFKLFCLDPSRHLALALRRCRAAIFFSATLTPVGYFQEILGCDAATLRLDVPSPFPRAHLKVLIANGVSTTYDQRRQSVDRVVSMIRAFVSTKRGNYLCFFPSYEYLALVTDRFEDPHGHTCVLTQAREMDDTERGRFLDRFSAQNRQTLVGFAVMGGIFGEGIDLVGERLSGAVIVGVGLPGIGPERELIRSYFDGQAAGFDFAYRYPGVNRVLQAAGRVIRTDRDRGALLLVDRRFCHTGYRRLLPDQWAPETVATQRQVQNHMKRFWSAAD